jgi:hypothetical protein
MPCHPMLADRSALEMEVLLLVDYARLDKLEKN